MAITKEKKSEIIGKLKEIFAKTPGAAFAQFHKLSVAQAQELRRKMRAAGAGYFVAKKTLIRKSLEGSSVKGEIPPLPGEIAVSYLENGNDATAPAREIFGFEKQFEKAIRLVGGIFEGRFIGEDEALSLAAIPPRQTLLAQFVNLLNSPMQRLAVALSETAKKKG